MEWDVDEDDGQSATQIAAAKARVKADAMLRIVQASVPFAYNENAPAMTLMEKAVKDRYFLQQTYHVQPEAITKEFVRAMQGDATRDQFRTVESWIMPSVDGQDIPKHYLTYCSTTASKCADELVSKRTAQCSKITLCFEMLKQLGWTGMLHAFTRNDHPKLMVPVLDSQWVPADMFQANTHARFHKWVTDNTKRIEGVFKTPARGWKSWRGEVTFQKLLSQANTWLKDVGLKITTDGNRKKKTYRIAVKFVHSKSESYATVWPQPSASASRVHSPGVAPADTYYFLGTSDK